MTQAMYSLSESARELVKRVAMDKEIPSRDEETEEVSQSGRSSPASQSKVPLRLCMVLANGCCDGTAAYLYANRIAESHWKIVLQDEYVDVYTSNTGPDVAGRNVQIHAVPDLSDSLSIESDYGYRFVVKFLAVDAIEEE